MSTGTALEESLEWILDDEDSLLCAASTTTHECTILAKWVCYAGPKCSTSGVTNVLWCDGRYEHYRMFSAGERALCKCGLVVRDHWRVVPL